MKKILGYMLLGLGTALVLILMIVIACQVAINISVNSMGNGILNRIEKYEKKIDEYINPNNERNQIMDAITKDYKETRLDVRIYSDKMAELKKIAKLTDYEVHLVAIRDITLSMKYPMVNWKDAKAIFTHESGYHPYVRGPLNEQGIGQLYGHPDMDWRKSWELCYKKLNYLTKLCNGDWRKIAYYYNGGTRIDKCKPESIARAKKYVKHIEQTKKRLFGEAV
jgi:hypothetical protein